MDYKKPCLIEFNKIGTTSEGFISVAEVGKQIPFDFKRVFWTYFTPESIIRGRHAHHETEMLLIAAAGKIIVETEIPNGDKNIFTLESPNYGVYLPPYCWHLMHYSHNTI